MHRDDETGRLTGSFEEMALYGLVLVEVISELLVEKGVLHADEFKQRMEGIKKEVSLRIRRTQ